MHTYLIRDKGLQVTPYLLCTSVLAFLLCASHTLSADTSTLERVAEAEREVSYMGVRLKTFSSPKGTRTFEEFVIHKPADATYRIVLSVVGERKSFGGSHSRDEHRGESHRDSRRKELDKRDRNSQAKERERRTWHQVKSLFAKKEIELIEQNYELEKLPSSEKIANYETDILTITPKFAGRPTKRIFFARKNGVILKVEDLDAEGTLRHMFAYIQINFETESIEGKWKHLKNEIETEVKRETREWMPISLTEGEEVLNATIIQPTYLPHGFQLLEMLRVKARKHTVQLRYTDGLMNFSLFETTEKHSRRGREQNRGSRVIHLNDTPVHKYQRGMLSWASAKIHFFLAFGEMDATEMQKVAESIIRNTK